MAHPVIRTLKAAQNFIAEVKQQDKDYFCCHGHFGCSTYHGGPCLEETLDYFEEQLEQE